MITKTRNNLSFIDSFQFMSTSLEKLVSNLKQSGIENFKHTKKEFKHNFEWMTRKGVYPYSYLTSFKNFNDDPKSLKLKHFKNDLTGQDIKLEDYNFFLETCDKFNIKTLGEYQNLYLKSDVTLLADVFENFRNVCLNYYDLDPCHYVSSPGLSWDACLKMTNIKLELFTDVDMYQFCEKSLRGGVSIVTHRKSKSADNQHIIYLDANNLYGYALSSALPYKNFKWIDPQTFKLQDYKTLCSNTTKKGHILEVDLVYPVELHDSHNEYPYCPEQMIVTDKMLSKYSKDIANKYKMKNSKVHKLIPNLKDKKNYVIHERNLRQAVDAGLVITKIHRVLQFRQKPWLKKYIDFNTSKRKEAKNEFEKDFFKLMNNSVFGKTMENLRKRQNIKLVTDFNKFKKETSKPTFIHGKIFNEKLVALHNIQEQLCLNKPVYVGFSVLEISKTLMYNFHYGFIKNNYNENAKLLYTDTDSLLYEVKTENIMKDLYNNKNLFDLSDVNDKRYCDDSNKKVIGKFKPEYPNEKIYSFIGLRSKMYSILCESGMESSRAKGITKCVVQN